MNETADPSTTDSAQARALRQEAAELLERLISSREQSERRAAEAGKRDPMKSITGHTSLDNAIASAREMMLQMDLLLEQVEGESAAVARSHSPSWAPKIVSRLPRVPVSATVSS